ncbi:isoleucine--tRNA ligase [Candidatus Saccharibacteria bacterium]|nr:isoleucine--tRNA ligase [Candidatus Saccharibacteria bacterium]
MKYRAGERRKAIEYEKAIVEWWKKNKTFEQSVKNRPIDKSYVFYDGPPFITGNPHHGTLLSSIVKDAVPRYWTMNGYHVERRWGWDCHGLPAENFVEKQLGITDRRDIGTKWTLEDYIIKARESMVANSETWRSTIDRIGRWVDFDNCYRTMNKDFMESVWWAFKKLYEAGKIYEGRKVLMYDTKFATPVSKAEVTMDNDAYQTVTDPSAYVLFRTLDGDLSRNIAKTEDPATNTYFLVWTTTPWTLPANCALAVNPKLKYGIFEIDNLRLVLAINIAEKLFPGAKPVETMPGADLVGEAYEPLLSLKVHESGEGYDLYGEQIFNSKDFPKVWAADFVTSEEGTGIVHIAPAYGEDDYSLYLDHKEDIGFMDVLDENGYYLPKVSDTLHSLGVRDTDEHGIQIWAANKFIAKCLEEKGIIYKIEYIQHEYPFNPRSKERIMYRAFPSWFFDIDGQKQMMLAENENINWFPAYLKHGRFANNIEAAPDWNLSRDRFWATAMPVWKGDKGTVKVIGSYEELYELSGVKLDDYHRPWVDEITFDIDGEHFTRIEKVLDCWFESGSMPFAQLHYPFENKEKFEANYPADFIVEYVGQVRAWFYYVHAVNTALAEIGAFGEKAKNGHRNAYKNVITTGTLAGNDGRKMSKSLGNFTDPNILMDQYSADALRFLLLSSPVLSGEDFALLDKDVSDVNRKLAMIWNVYDFFTTYAEIEGWESPAAPGIFGTGKLADLKNPLDSWILARLYETRLQVINGMDEYNIPKALDGILPFIDDLSNWFVRRSRRRFNKNPDMEDKQEAFWTLWKVLEKTAVLLAPFTPFLAEELWQKLVGGWDKEKSVHLLDYPKTTEIDDKEVLDNMTRTRQIITDALALRMRKSDTEEQIKVRQPLSKLTYDGEKLPDFYEQIIADEVNVKEVKNSDQFALDKTLTDDLKREGYARDLIRAIQTARKNAKLNMDDKIKLSLSIDLPKGFEGLVKSEAQAEEFAKDANYAHDEIAKIGGENITISLEKI